MGQVVTLDTLEGSVSDAYTHYHQDHSLQRMKHAGVVLYGSTKKEKGICKEGRMSITLEICLERDAGASLPEISLLPGNSSVPSLSGGVVCESLPSVVSSLPVASVFATRHTQPPTAPTPSSSSLIAPVPLYDSEEAHALLARKLADPTCVLSDSESIVLLTHCVAEGVEYAKKIAGKDVVIILGDTGADRSTFLDYLSGYTKVNKIAKGSEDKKIVVAQSKSGSSACDEILLVGYDTALKTFVPYIALAPDNASLAYCDFPGFFDNRGMEINIASGVNMRRVFEEARLVKVLILINYHSLLANRGGIREILKTGTQLFGSDANRERFKDAVLLGITKVPVNTDVAAFKEWLLDGTPPIIEKFPRICFCTIHQIVADQTFCHMRIVCVNFLHLLGFHHLHQASYSRRSLQQRMSRNSWRL